MVLAGRYNGAAALENSLPFFSKLCRVTLRPTSSPSSYVLKRIEGMCIRNDLYVSVPSRIFVLAVKRKPGKCPSTEKWIKNVVSSHSGILLSRYKAHTVGTFDNMMSLENVTT